MTGKIHPIKPIRIRTSANISKNQSSMKGDQDKRYLLALLRRVNRQAGK